jgi:hypothetical protein
MDLNLKIAESYFGLGRIEEALLQISTDKLSKK